MFLLASNAAMMFCTKNDWYTLASLLNVYDQLPNVITGYAHFFKIDYVP